MIRHNFSASRVMAFVLGAFTGYLGIEHGYFEILQGNIRPTGMMIRAMGTPCQAATSPVGCEPAMTVMPNFLVTGVLAILVSLAIITWQGLRVSRKHGSIGLILLSILLLFVGGGFTPLPFGILAGVACAGINASPAGWQAHLPVILRGVLAKLWPWLLLISMIWYLGMDHLKDFLNLSTTFLGISSLTLCGLAVLAGFMHDLQKRIPLQTVTSI